MFKRKVMALAVSSLSVLAGCSTVSAPEGPVLPARAGTVAPVMAVRNSRGVDGEGYYRIGRNYQGEMRYDDAVAAYRNAINLDPNHVEAHNALGVMQATQGLALEAEREFRAAIALAPERSHLHSNLGYHLMQLGRTDEARAALREAVRLGPANARAWNNLAAVEGKPRETVATAAVAPAAAIVAEPVAPVAQSASPTATVPTPIAPPATVVAEVRTPFIAATPAIEAADVPSMISATISVAPVSQLRPLGSNAWELRPREVQVASAPERPAAPIAQASVSQPEPAIASAALPAGVKLEISNGNGVTGLARRVGGYMRSLGLSSPRLTNQRPFAQRTTEIQYVAGMEGTAKDLKVTLGTPAELVATPRIDRNAQIRVVLGRDFHEIEAVARMPWVKAKQIALAPGQ